MNKTSLLAFIIGQEISEMNPQAILPCHGNDTNFHVFPLFLLLVTFISLRFRANWCSFIRDIKKEPLNKCAKFHLHISYQTAVTITV